MRTRDAGRENIEIVTADASITDAYAGAVPADLVPLCGVFGNINAEEIERTIEYLPRFASRTRASSGPVTATHLTSHPSSVNVRGARLQGGRV
jgi:hypothetical protein